MSRIALAATLGLLTLATAALPAAAQPAGTGLQGRWKAATDEAVIVIAPCGAALCGKVVDSSRLRANPDSRDFKNRDPGLRDRKVDGMMLMQGFTGGPTEWKGGTLYNPEDGGTYTGKITADGPDAIKLTGCIIFPLCKTQVWTRIK